MKTTFIRTPEKFYPGPTGDTSAHLVRVERVGIAAATVFVAELHTRAEYESRSFVSRDEAVAACQSFTFGVLS